MSQRELQEMYYSDVAKLVRHSSGVFLKSTYQCVRGAIERADEDDDVVEQMQTWASKVENKFLLGGYEVVA